MSWVMALSTAWLLRRGRRREALFMLAAGGGALLLGRTLRVLFRRQRPSGTAYRCERPKTYSFPSGHAMGSAGVLLAGLHVLESIDAPEPLRRRAALCSSLLLRGSPCRGCTGASTTRPMSPPAHSLRCSGIASCGAASPDRPGARPHSSSAPQRRSSRPAKRRDHLGFVPPRASLPSAAVSSPRRSRRAPALPASGGVRQRVAPRGSETRRGRR